MNEQLFQGDVKKHHNRLIHEKSPYLLQHAHNPVDWYPWNEEAFEEAKRENKPIFLSIGYSTCHWCHVMAHESFEDSEVAVLMNNSFVCIKVDREERPDIDKLYMSVCQLMTGGGGWPLTIIMTPDKKPFFAGTYLPKSSRFGVIGLLELIPQIKKLWKTQDVKLITYADQIIDALQDFNGKSHTEALDKSILRETYELLAQVFDKQFGGFGRAPKFPTPHNILFLLRYWRRTGIDAPLSMAEKTLRSMRQGGIYDHIGFGFHRYSTDPGWLLPHFEKMLYDQALLTMAYIETYQATKNKEHLQTAQEILSYVLRDMTAPEGGFYSAEDADSEGQEGKFYLWTYDEVLQVLKKEDTNLIIKIFNLSPKGNFQEGGTKQKIANNNIFHMEKILPEIASDMGMAIQDLRDHVENAREKLFAFRENRVHPYKDDKILTDWNGLMIAALAKAGRVFDEQKYKEAAICAADFILTNMRTSDGLLLHRYRDGQAEITGYLDDYAFFIWGLLELFESTFEATYLKSALKLQQDLEKHFWDQSAGGFFFTPDVSEDLLVRQKELYDGAVPAGNSISILNLLRLAHITSNPHFLEQAAAIERIFSKKVKENPNGYTQFMVALDFALGPSCEVFITGHSHSEDTKEMLRSLQTNFIPNKTVIFRPAEQKVSDIDGISPFIRYCKSIEGKATAYVCQNNACNKPTTEVKELLEMLNARNK